jgi:hypothetical protein
MRVNRRCSCWGAVRENVERSTCLAEHKVELCHGLLEVAVVERTLFEAMTTKLK